MLYVSLYVATLIKCEFFVCVIRVYVHSGRIETALPGTLPPGAEGSGVFVKTSNSACGSVGVFTYDLCRENKNTGCKRMAVMFSVPYDYNLHSNYCAVGITDTSKNCDNTLYEEMYYGKDGSWFDRITASVGNHVYRTDDLDIKCKMIDSHQPTLIINIK